MRQTDLNGKSSLSPSVITPINVNDSSRYIKRIITGAKQTQPVSFSSVFVQYGRAMMRRNVTKVQGVVSEGRKTSRGNIKRTCARSDKEKVVEWYHRKTRRSRR